MGALLLYILKSTICLILFYLGLKALLSNDTFFRFNRWVLLVGIATCMLLPAIKIQTSEPLLIQQPIIHLEKMIAGEETVVTYLSDNNPEVDRTPVATPAKMIDWGQIIALLYWAGFIFCLLTTLLSFRKMFVLIRSGRKLQQGRYTLILVPSCVSPFSWGRYIILSEEDYEKYPDEILTHEMMHLKSHHSIDLLFMECILWLHWFNPAIWLLKRELKDIHEYQADKGVLTQGIDATKYQLLLVKKAVGSSLYTLANSFNHSKIKKRITMMLKGKSNNWARLKLLLLVPVGLIVLNAFARPEVNRQLETLVQSKDKETPPEEQQDMKSFFKTELEKYMREKVGVTTPSNEDKEKFLEKETNKQVLLVNALGQILLNNEFVSYNDLPEKLKQIFETSSARSVKPVAFYSMIDRGVPPKASANILSIVNSIFLKQQEKSGVSNVPILFYEDNARNKDQSGNNYWINPNYVYFSINGKKLSLEEFILVKDQAVRGTTKRSELNDAKGKVIEVIPYFKRKDGKVTPDNAYYFELPAKLDDSLTMSYTEKKNNGSTAYPVLISYRTASFESGVYEATLSKKMENVKATAERISKGKEKVEELTVLPANKDVPLSYLEAVKQVLEGKGLSCTIKNKVPDGIK